MNEGVMESARMLRVVVDRSNDNRSRKKWLIGSLFVVVSALLFVGKQSENELSLTAKSGATVKALHHIMGKAAALPNAVQKLMEGRHHAVNSGTLADVKTSHLVEQSTPEDSIPSTQSPDSDSASPKVRVRLFMESKCPACKMFTSQYVNKVLHSDGMSNIIDFKFVPWGNGQISKNGATVNTTEGLSSLLSQLVVDGDEGKNAGKGVSFFCQHGGAECAGNAYESCTQHLYPDMSQSFPVIDCIESRACAEGEKPGENCDGNPADVAPTCIREFGDGMDAALIHGCVTGPLGAQLLLTNALETAELDPPKQWVPWITVNGRHLGQRDPRDIFLLGKAVCDAYNASGGSDLPEACNSFPSVIPTNPYGRSDAVSDDSVSRSWWMVVLGVVVFVAAIAGLYYFFTTAQVAKAEPVAEHV